MFSSVPRTPFALPPARYFERDISLVDAFKLASCCSLLQSLVVDAILLGTFGFSKNLMIYMLIVLSVEQWACYLMSQGCLWLHHEVDHSGQAIDPAMSDRLLSEKLNDGRYYSVVTGCVSHMVGLACAIFLMACMHEQSSKLLWMFPPAHVLATLAIAVPHMTMRSCGRPAGLLSPVLMEVQAQPVITATVVNRLPLDSTVARLEQGEVQEVIEVLPVDNGRNPPTCSTVLAYLRHNVLGFSVPNQGNGQSIGASVELQAG